ncbi:hypothetical protein ZWY2020_050127 [Hordeum vulgare]|nr:hypothetical protein ZWY2020_050127 [Hordeum vulgare]
MAPFRIRLRFAQAFSEKEKESITKLGRRLLPLDKTKSLLSQKKRAKNTRRRRRFDLIGGDLLLPSPPALSPVTGAVDPSVVMSSANATSCVYGEISNDGFARLHTGDDFTSSPSSNTLQEFGDAWIAAAERQLSLRPKSPSPEELMKRRQERKRKGLVIALNTYAKQNNMQLTDLEFVEEKERNQVYGRGALKRMFFAALLWKKTTMVIAWSVTIEQRSLGIPRAVATWVDMMR